MKTMEMTPVIATATTGNLWRTILRGNLMPLFLVVLGMLAVLPAHSEVLYLIGRGTNYQYFTWDTTCPTGCPFSASSYRRLQFTGRWATYTAADTFYPTWGDDDVLYTPWTDGSIGDYGTAAPNPGHCKAEGGDPLYLTIGNVSSVKGDGKGYAPYPC
jgi:hypothetical protein